MSAWLVRSAWTLLAVLAVYSPTSHAARCPMLIGSKEIREIWFADFEFSAPPGERPTPVCLVALELNSGRKIRLWQDELKELPYSIGPNALFVAFYASAELGCHLALGWPTPVNVLDLYTEFRCLTNGKATPCGASLLGALAYYGLDAIGAAEKETMRQLVLRGGPWSDEERRSILDYCESDVLALSRLFERMLPEIDLERALLRGRYMAAAARIEDRGVPIDVGALGILRENWDAIQERLIERIDADYEIFEGRSFKAARLEKYLAAHDIPWPRLPSGALSLDDDTFKEMSRSHPEIAPIRELRLALSQMRLSDLAVGSDGRNRCLLSAFRSITGRNQPSNARFIFGPSVWLRSLIRPEPGYGLAYLDWCQQEFAIAGHLSGDAAMIHAYESGDPYLAFAKQAGAIPADGTKKTHGPVREQFKSCALAVLYGMGPESLALRIRQPVSRARELLKLHRDTFPKFWNWSDGVVDHGMLHGRLWTVFGWTYHVGPQANPRSLRNFPMQANGAEMLRLACCLATERGIRVCAPVHDALLIEAPLDQLDRVVAETQAIMAQASAIVLGGPRLRSDAKLVRYPDRYMDERGEKMWNQVWALIHELRPELPDRRWSPHLTACGAIPDHGSTPALSTSISPMAGIS
ncbi:MAG: DNA polymerase [Elusimicrobiota bacterium]